MAEINELTVLFNCIYNLVQRQEMESTRLCQSKQCVRQMNVQAMQGKDMQRAVCAKHIRVLYYSHYNGTNGCPGVLAIAIRVMEFSLMKVKIPDKYLKCFASACFLIANKWEDDENVVGLQRLVQLNFMEWRATDLERMEERVLKTLEWTIPRVTYLDFLPLLHKALRLPELDHSHMQMVYFKAERVLIHSSLSLEVKPAAIALECLLHCCALERGKFYADEALVGKVSNTLKIDLVASHLEEIGEFLNRVSYSNTRSYLRRLNLDSPFGPVLECVSTEAVEEETYDADSGTEESIDELSSDDEQALDDVSLEIVAGDVATEIRDDQTSDYGSSSDVSEEDVIDDDGSVSDDDASNDANEDYDNYYNDYEGDDLGCEVPESSTTTGLPQTVIEIRPAHRDSKDSPDSNNNVVGCIDNSVFARLKTLVGDDSNGSLDSRLIADIESLVVAEEFDNEGVTDPQFVQNMVNEFFSRDEDKHM